MEPEKEKKKRPRPVLVAGLLLALAAAVVAILLGGYTPFYRAFLQAPRQDRYAVKIKDIGDIEYVARINPGLYRGAYPKDDLGVLKRLGVRTIINFRYRESHDYEDEARAAGFEYYWMPINPSEPPGPDFIAKFFSIVDDPAKRPVYIHCTLGIDRTGMMSGLYRMERDGWANEEAAAEMEYFGHNELWHDLEKFVKNHRPGSFPPKPRE